MNTGRLQVASPKFSVWCELESNSRETIHTGFSDFERELPCGGYWLRLETGKEREEHRIAIAPGETTVIDLTEIPAFSHVSTHHECEGYSNWNNVSLDLPAESFGRMLVACYPVDSKTAISGDWFLIECSEFDRAHNASTKVASTEIDFKCDQRGAYYSENLKPGYYYFREQSELASPICGFPVVPGWDVMILCRFDGWIDFGNATVFLRPTKKELGGELNDDLLTELILSQFARQQYVEVSKTFKRIGSGPEANPVACLAYLYSKVLSGEPLGRDFKEIVDLFPKELRILSDWQLLAMQAGTIRDGDDWQFQIPTLFSDGWFLAFITRHKAQVKVVEGSQMEYFANIHRNTLWCSYLPQKNSVLDEAIRSNLLENLKEALLETFKKKQVVTGNIEVPETLGAYKKWRADNRLMTVLTEDVNNELLRSCSERTGCFEELVARLFSLPEWTEAESLYLKRFSTDSMPETNIKTPREARDYPFARSIGIIERIESEQMIAGRAAPRVGSRVSVFCKIFDGNKSRIQRIEGTVIGLRGTRVNQTFTLRRLVLGCEALFTFPVHSPAIEGIEVHYDSMVSRAKLNFLKGMTARQEQKKLKKKDRRLPKLETPSIHR